MFILSRLKWFYVYLSYIYHPLKKIIENCAGKMQALFSPLANSLIKRFFTRRARVPAFVNPKPLFRVTSDVIFDDVRYLLG